MEMKELDVLCTTYNVFFLCRMALMFSDSTALILTVYEL
jgi:hypothetical protein